MAWVRWRTSKSRVRNTTAAACACSLFTATKRMVGRWAASQIASASAMSFFWRLTNGFTYAGAISFTVWPSLAISRPQEWALAQASMATVPGGSVARNARSWPRRSFLRRQQLPRCRLRAVERWTWRDPVRRCSPGSWTPPRGACNALTLAHHGRRGRPHHQALMEWAARLKLQTALAEWALRNLAAMVLRIMGASGTEGGKLGPYAYRAVNPKTSTGPVNGCWSEFQAVEVLLALLNQDPRVIEG